MRGLFSSALAIPVLCAAAVPASAADRIEIALTADIQGPEGAQVGWDLHATPEGMEVEAQVPQNASRSFKRHGPARVNGRFRTGNGAIEAAGASRSGPPAASWMWIWELPPGASMPPPAPTGWW